MCLYIVTEINSVASEFLATPNYSQTKLSVLSYHLLAICGEYSTVGLRKTTKIDLRRLKTIHRIFNLLLEFVTLEVRSG